MRGITYKDGSTFRAPRLSGLRAEYAASLRDQGLSYTAIAWALGLHGKRRRAFQVVQHGRSLRDAAIVAKIKGTVLGSVLDANAISAGDMYRYLHLAIEREYQQARKLADDELAAESTAPDYYTPIRDAFTAREARLGVVRHEGTVPLPAEVTVTTIDGHTAQYTLAQEEIGQ